MKELTPAYAKTARPYMVAMVGEIKCDICNKDALHYVQAARSAYICDSAKDIHVCQACINQMYVTACYAFNVRPHELY